MALATVPMVLWPWLTDGVDACLGWGGVLHAAWWSPPPRLRVRHEGSSTNASHVSLQCAVPSRHSLWQTVSRRTRGVCYFDCLAPKLKPLG